MTDSMFTPCTDPNCDVEQCKTAREAQPETLAELRDELDVNSLEYYRAKASEFEAELSTQRDKAERYERYFNSKVTAISNFETAIYNLLEEDDESVSWDSLERALDYLGISLSRVYMTTFTVTFNVTASARNEEAARAIFENVYSFSVSDREIDDYEVESYEFDDVELN